MWESICLCKIYYSLVRFFPLCYSDFMTHERIGPHNLLLIFNFHFPFMCTQWQDIFISIFSYLRGHAMYFPTSVRWIIFYKLYFITCANRSMRFCENCFSWYNNLVYSFTLRHGEEQNYFVRCSCIFFLILWHSCRSMVNKNTVHFSRVSI